MYIYTLLALHCTALNDFAELGYWSIFRNLPGQGCANVGPFRKLFFPVLETSSIIVTPIHIMLVETQTNRAPETGFSFKTGTSLYIREHMRENTSLLQHCVGKVHRLEVVRVKDATCKCCSVMVECCVQHFLNLLEIIVTSWWAFGPSSPSQ